MSSYFDSVASRCSRDPCRVLAGASKGIRAQLPHEDRMTDPNRRFVCFSDLPRVCAWFADSDRKPADLAFTSGPDRDLAHFLETYCQPTDAACGCAAAIAEKYKEPPPPPRDEAWAERILSARFERRDWTVKAWKKTVVAMVQAANAAPDQRYAILRPAWPKGRDYNETVLEVVDDLNDLLLETS